MGIGHEIVAFEERVANATYDEARTHSLSPTYNEVTQLHREIYEARESHHKEYIDIGTSHYSLV